MTRKLKRKNQQGITLIALVITIIVLLILAGISIATLTGENGVLSKAGKAKLKDDNAKVYEALKLEEQDYLVEVTTNMTQKDLITRLKEDNIIDNNYIINIQVLLGTKLSTGNGTGTKDVYKLEEITELGKMANIETVKLASNSNSRTYMVVYYDEKGERTELGTIGGFKSGTGTGYYDGLDVTPTNAEYFEFVYNEDTKTAALTGVKDEHIGFLGYYEGKKAVISIIDGATEITDVVIPAVISKNNIEYKITEIGENVFRLYNYPGLGMSKFTSFTIPNTVTNVGESAFAGCRIATFNLSKNLTDIGSGAFENCKKLTSIDGLLKLTTIGSEGFSGTGLVSVSLPEGCTKLGQRVFANCESLTKMVLPSSLTEIQYLTFHGFSPESLIVSDGNPVLDSRENCNAIIETETNTLIRGCKNTTIPKTVVKLGVNCFSGVGGLRSISLPESVVEIGGGAFSQCENLESVNIPSGVTEIKYDTFATCSSLTSILIPKTVTSIAGSNYSSAFRRLY